MKLHPGALGSLAFQYLTEGGNARDVVAQSAQVPSRR